MTSPRHASPKESAESIRMAAALAKARTCAEVVGPRGGARCAARNEAEVSMVREAVANAR